MQLGELGDVAVERVKEGNGREGGRAERSTEKDMRAVTTAVAAPMTKEPLKMPRKTPTDLKKAEASNMCVLAPLGW